MASLCFLVRFIWPTGSYGESRIYCKDTKYLNKYINWLLEHGCTEITFRKELSDETQENG